LERRQHRSEGDLFVFNNRGYGVLQNVAKSLGRSIAVARCFVGTPDRHRHPVGVDRLTIRSVIKTPFTAASHPIPR